MWWNEDDLLISPKDKIIIISVWLSVGNTVRWVRWEEGEHGRQKEVGSSPGTSLCIAPRAFEPHTCCTPWQLSTRCPTPQAQQLKTRTLCLWQPESPTLTRRGCDAQQESSSEWHTGSSTAGRNCACAHRSNVKIHNKSRSSLCACCR